MDQRRLRAAADAYPHTHLQGLYGIPFGLMMLLVAASNRDEPPSGTWTLLLGLVVVAGVLAAVAAYYARSLGRAAPAPGTRRRLVRGGLAGIAVFLVLDQLGRAAYDDAVSVTAPAWAAGMLVAHALSTGVRPHVTLVWGCVAAAGLVLPGEAELLPYVVIAAGLAVAGVLDHLAMLRVYRAVPRERSGA